MTVTSFVPCHTLHFPQHVAVSLSEPLNQISSAASTEKVFLWWFLLFYVLVFKCFVLLAPYVCYPNLVKFR